MWQRRLWKEPWQERKAGAPISGWIIPNRDDEHWLRHTLAFKTAEGVKLDYKEVTITSYPPKERTY